MHRIPDAPRRLPIACAIFFAFLLSLSAHAETPTGGPQNRFTLPHVSDQLIVQYKSGFRQDLVDARIRNLGMTRLRRFRALNMELLSVPAGFRLDRFASELAAESMVALVEPNYIYSKQLRPNDGSFSSQWALENTGGNYSGGSGFGVSGADLNLVAAWNTQALASNAVIAIIDDAVETSHEDLAPNILPGGRCFASFGDYCNGQPTNPNPTDSDQDHGTAVAGAAAARGNNGIGVASPAWEARILPLKTDLTTAAITAAIDEAILRGAHIINMSFGGPEPSSTTRTALQAARDSGILVVTSAGNADSNSDSAKAHFPSNYNLDNVISVAASNGYDDIQDFSQWGAFGVQLAAPGHRVYTTAVNNDYSNVSGTSFSSPLVAGVAALVKAHTGASGNNAWKTLRAHLLYGGVVGKGLGFSQVPGRDKKAIPGRVQAGRLDAQRALAGPPGGVLVINSVTVDDSASGNANGQLDPGETAMLVIELENVWTAETNVTGRLSTLDTSVVGSSLDSGRLSVDPASRSFGLMAQDQKVSASFPVTLGSVTNNEQYFFTLSLQSDAGTLPDRYFYLEIGTLNNGVQVSQATQRTNWDEFQGWHIDVPAGAKNLVIETATNNSIDIDLLARYGAPPEYLITLDADPEDASPWFFTDNQTQISGQAAGNETITIANPQAGTYFIVIVNFDQVSHNYSLTATYDPPPAGSLQFEQSSYAIDEDDGTLTLGVTRSNNQGAVSINYATSNGTAIGGQDFAAASGTLNWADGDTGTKTFSINILNDAELESTEQFSVKLSNPGGGAVQGFPSTATVTVRDDDSQGEFYFTDAVVSAIENASMATISVTRTSGNLNGPVSIDYASSPGTATSTADYLDVSGTLNWGQGETGIKTFMVPLVDDLESEITETVQLALSNPQGGATLGQPAAATLRIIDDDNPGVIGFSVSDFVFEEQGSLATIEVSRADGSKGAISVSYSTTDGTAMSPGDFVAGNGTLVWTDGDVSSKSFTVTLIDDNELEPNETVQLALASPTGGATLGADQATLTIIDNDDPGVIRFASANYELAEDGQALLVSVTRSGGDAAGTISVNYATTDGTALAGSDYTASSGTLVWLDGQTGARQFSIPILDDSVFESSETFRIELAQATGGARLGFPDTSSVRILDNDQPGQLRFTSPNNQVSESVGTVNLFVSRTGGSTGQVSATYDFSGSVAMSGSDFTAAPGTLIWADGDVSNKLIAVTIIDDNVAESAESIVIQLSAPTGGVTLFNDGRATISVFDNDTGQGGGGGGGGALGLLGLPMLLGAALRLRRRRP